MKGTLILLTLSLAVLLVGACSQNDPTIRTAQPAPKAEIPAASDVNSATATGAVTETMNAAGYTYVQVDTGSQKVWAAAPEFQVNVGDQVVVPEGMPMRNFHSNTLDREFEVVYFVGSILNSSGGAPAKGAEMPAGHPPTAVTSTPAQIDVSGVEKAEGGNTVGELFAEKDELSGKEVSVRGKVVKFSRQIMGKNWLHLQDGSGDAAAGTNDLTATTDATVEVGDTVLVSGSLVLDKDFGFGYKYALIIEDAKVTVE